MPDPNNIIEVLWHPSGVHSDFVLLPGVSSQAPQPPANFCQPFGLGPELIRAKQPSGLWPELRAPVNPEGCQKLAGGRSRTETPGIPSQKNIPHPGGVPEFSG